MYICLYEYMDEQLGHLYKLCSVDQLLAVFKLVQNFSTMQYVCYTRML